MSDSVNPSTDSVLELSKIFEPVREQLSRVEKEFSRPPGSRGDLLPAGGTSRRMGGGKPGRKTVELKAERDAIDAQADFIIQTDDMTPDQVTHQLLTAFRERSAVAGGTG